MVWPSATGPQLLIFTVFPHSYSLTLLPLCRSNNTIPRHYSTSPIMYLSRNPSERFSPMPGWTISQHLPLSLPLNCLVGVTGTQYSCLRDSLKFLLIFGHAFSFPSRVAFCTLLNPTACAHSFPRSACTTLSSVAEAGVWVIPCPEEGRTYGSNFVYFWSIRSIGDIRGSSEPCSLDFKKAYAWILHPWNTLSPSVPWMWLFHCMTPSHFYI